MFLLLFFQTPEFTDTKVQPMKEYEYRVTAVNAGGESEPSDVSKPIKAKPLKQKPKVGLNTCISQKEVHLNLDLNPSK